MIMMDGSGRGMLLEDGTTTMRIVALEANIHYDMTPGTGTWKNIYSVNNDDDDNIDPMVDNDGDDVDNNLTTSSSINNPMKKDVSQNYSIQLSMNTMSETKIKNIPKWKKKTLINFHWSKGYKSCPYLDINLMNINDEGKTFKGKVPVTSMVYYPFQVVDIWCVLNDEHNLPSGFIRLIMTYQPEKIPIAPELKNIDTIIINNKNKKNNNKKKNGTTTTTTTTISSSTIARKKRQMKNKNKPTFGARKPITNKDKLIKKKNNPILQNSSFKFDNAQLLSIGDFELATNNYIYLNVLSAKKIKGVHMKHNNINSEIKSLYVKIALQSTSRGSQDFPWIGVTKEVSLIRYQPTLNNNFTSVCKDISVALVSGLT